jgi:hypothetical protein
MIRRILCVSVLPALLIVASWLAIGCNSNLLTAITIQDRNVCVLIPKDVQVTKVIIDGNEVLPEQFTEKRTGEWAEVSYYKTPNIKAWMENNIERARQAYEKASYDYEVWAYDMIKEGRILDPRIREKQEKYEQKVQEAKRELDKWDTLFNTGLPTNWVDELRKYVTIEIAKVE